MALPNNLISPKERPLFVIGVAFSSAAWLFLTLGTLGIGLFYSGLFAVGILIAHALFLAHVKGNGVKLSPQQLPDLYQRCEVAARKLGMAHVPEIYLLQSGGILNAFATKLLSRRFVIIYSSLVSECHDPRQLDFVIGHELGHHAAGHLGWNAFLAPFMIVPWLGAAYSRAREYTCDRCGHEVAADLDASMRALVVLAAGGKYAGEISIPAFMAQRDEAGSFWMATLELVSSHPYLCKRVAELKALAEPGTVQPVSRNPLAYPFAPLFAFGAVGGSASSLLVIVAIMGILAAIAIPNFMRFQDRAKKAQATMLHRAQPSEPTEDAEAKDSE